MTQLLTDNEISTVVHNIDCAEVRPFDIDFARAIESAVLAKLREQDEPCHVLWKTGEVGVPSAILDRNGEVVLGLCKICGKGECDLVEPCKPHPAPIPEGYALVPTKPNQAILDLMYSNGMDMHDGDLTNVWTAILLAAARSEMAKEKS